MERTLTSAVVVLIALILTAAAGIGIGWGFGTTVPNAPTGGAAAPSVQANVTNSTFQITLVEVMSNTWNSSAPLQPKVFVVGPQGLESSADIVLPAHRLIQLTIVAYDAPTPNSTEAMATVTGTVGGKVYLINGTLGSGMTSDAMSMMTQWGQNATSVPLAALTGTITLPQLGINVPFAGGETTIAYLRFDQSGTFTWICQPPCGLGKDGLSGAMSTPGWMMGEVTVR